MASLKFGNYFYMVALIFVLLFYSWGCDYSNVVHINNDYNGLIISDFGNAILRSDGKVWGNGNGFDENFKILIPGETQILGHFSYLNNIIAMDMSFGRRIAADRNGSIYYWGDNFISSTMGPKITIPQIIAKLSNVISIEFLGNDVNLLTESGELYRINISPGKPVEYKNPEKISGFRNISKLSETMALGKDGVLYELQHTEPEYGGLSFPINDVVDFDNVANRRTVVLKKDGTVWAWGQNWIGELGNGTCENSKDPVQVKGLTDIIDISANWDYNLALKKDGTAWFWGYAGRDEKEKSYGFNTPVKIENLDNIVLIYAYYFCYFMKKDRTYWSYQPRVKKLGKVVLQ